MMEQSSAVGGSLPQAWPHSNSRSQIGAAACSRSPTNGTGRFFLTVCDTTPAAFIERLSQKGVVPSQPDTAAHHPEALLQDTRRLVVGRS